MLGADQCIEFIFTRDRIEVDLNCGNADEIEDVIIAVVTAIEQ